MYVLLKMFIGAFILYYCSQHYSSPSCTAENMVEIEYEGALRITVNIHDCYNYLGVESFYRLDSALVSEDNCLALQEMEFVNSEIWGTCHRPKLEGEGFNQV